MESRQEVYETLAGLLRGHGYAARVEPAYRDPREPKPVVALVTCAPPIVIGMCLGNTAEEPEAHLPTKSAKVARPKQWEPGDPQLAWWV